MQEFRTQLANGIDTIEKLYNKQDRLLGIPTGFMDFDHMTSGLQPGNLIVIAARPSMGKTTLVLNMAQNIAFEEKRPVVFFSLEMPSQDIAMRMLATESRIDFKRLRTGSFSEEHWRPLTEGASRLAEAPILINDDPSLTVQSLHDEALRLKNEHSNLALIIVDYLQMLEVDTKYSTREEDLSEISRALKVLAWKLKVPVIACSQLSREVERRPDKRPRLSDLRGSGAIGETADLVAFLHRDDYYEDENVGDRVEANIMIKKQRNGPTGTVILYFSKNQMRFENPS
jgi:replicative DNA helicase